MGYWYIPNCKWLEKEGREGGMSFRLEAMEGRGKGRQGCGYRCSGLLGEAKLHKASLSAV